MPNINFYLRDPKAAKETPINLFLSARGRRLKIPVGEKIHPRFWNPKKQVAKNTYPSCIELNKFLQQFKEDVLKIYLTIISGGIDPTSKLIKKKLNNQRSRVSEVDFGELLDRFIEDGRSTKAANTVQTYGTLKFHLLGFQEKTRYHLSFSSINIDFRDKFHHFLTEVRNLNNTSVHKNFAVLKRFMSYATEHGHNQSTDFLKFKFKIAPSTKIALTENELGMIRSVDLSDSPSLERVRDMFLFGCETSLRHGDLANVKPSNIKTTIIEGNEITYLDLIVQKTRGEIQAPLSQKALTLINEYASDERSTCFPVISNQKFNKYIKEVGKLAGLDDDVEVVKYVGNKRIQEHIPKYELISSHTQRRTFVTLHFERGGSVASCMVYTGHKSYKELETYRKKTLQHRLKIAKMSPHVPKRII